MRKRAGIALLGLGGLVLAWCAVTVQWGDPVTALYTRHAQQGLERQLDELNREWAPESLPPRSEGGSEPSPVANIRDVTKAHGKATRARRTTWKLSRVKARATVYKRRLKEEQAVGEIVVPKLNLRMIVVEGTTVSALRKGPGHYNAKSGIGTGLPGMGGVVAIAGHRTTYQRPFRYIDTLKKGDRVFLNMPYGKFTYMVYGHKIVSPTNWSILHKNRKFEKLVLSACHPLFSAAQRWVVFAKLIRIQPPVPVKH